MMAITFYVPAYLTAYTEGRHEVAISTAGQTVGEALMELWKVRPGLRDRVVTEQNEVRQHLNIFVGEDNIRDRNGLATAIVDGCEITILPSVSGG
jgi:sulfur-carrier protein